MPSRFEARELALKDSSISRQASLLYLAIDNYQRDNPDCWPAQNSLARDLRCSVRSVQRFLAELVGAGLCSASRRAYGASNSYVLHWRQGCRVNDDRDVASVTTELARHKANQALKPERQGASAEREKPPVTSGVCRSCRGQGRILIAAIGWSGCAPCRGTGREQTRRTA